MTISLAVDDNNDLTLGANNNLAISRGIDAVRQNCLHAAKTIQGEMILAVDEGLPYFTAVWNGPPRVSVFEAALRRALLAVDGVTGIVALATVVSNNVLSYSVTISTIYGEADLNG